MPCRRHAAGPPKCSPSTAPVRIGGGRPRSRGQWRRGALPLSSGRGLCGVAAPETMRASGSISSSPIRRLSSNREGAGARRQGLSQAGAACGTPSELRRIPVRRFVLASRRSAALCRAGSARAHRCESQRAYFRFHRRGQGSSRTPCFAGKRISQGAVLATGLGEERVSPKGHRMNWLTAFGLFSVTAMLICYGLENRSSWYIAAFAGACALASVYGYLQGAWPFGLVEAVWSVVALRRWHMARTSPRRDA